MRKLAETLLSKIMQNQTIEIKHGTLLRNLLAIAGRLLLAALFLLSGLSKIGASAATIAYISSKGLPFPVFVYALTIAVEVGGGVLLLTGTKARSVSILLAVFTVAAAVIFHSQFSDPNQAAHFLKNLAIVGGLLQIAAAGAGRFSIDARQKVRADRDAVVNTST
jgi:putative oxidoreductase